MAAVNFAREHGLPLSVRGGGHSVPGFGTNDGGVVIDLSLMHGVHVDPKAKHRARRGRVHLGRLQPRDLRLRPGDDRRDHRLDRQSAADARRRHRLPDPRLRAVVRQPALGRRRHRRRQVPGRQRERERGPVLGDPRRRRQLRRRHRRSSIQLHPVQRHRTAACSSSSSSDAADVLAVLPRVHPRRAGGARRLPGASRSRRRCRSSPRTATARRSCIIVALLGRRRSRRARRRSSRSATSRRVVAEMVGPMPYPALNSAFDALVPPGLAALLEGQLRHRAHRRRDRRAPGARAEGAGGELDDAHLPDQRRLPPRGAGRDRVRLPRRDLRDRDRRHVAGPRRERREHRVGAGLLRRDRARTPRRAATSTSWPTTTRTGSGTTTAATTTGWSRSSARTTRTTCSASTRTSSRKGLF